MAPEASDSVKKACPSAASIPALDRLPALNENRKRTASPKPPENTPNTISSTSISTRPGIIQLTLFSIPSCTPLPTISMVNSVTSVLQPPSTHGLALLAAKIAAMSSTLLPARPPESIFHK